MTYDENYSRWAHKTENGIDAKPRAEGACTLCRGAKEEKPAKQD